MTLKILNSVLSMDEYSYTSADTLLLQIKSQCASYVFFTEFCVEKDLCPHSLTVKRQVQDTVGPVLCWKSDILVSTALRQGVVLRKK